jgi:hypothetical protein
LGATIVEISRLKLNKVNFYTIKVDDRPAEYQDFIQRMNQIYPDKLGQLSHIIDQIGNKFGAIKNTHFKHERNADALPPPYFKFKESGTEPTSQFGLRLYCAVLSQEVVILYNGDLKTNQYPDQCPNVRRHFHFALNATKKVDEAILNGSMAVSGMDLLVEDGYELDL